ncbi:hypothetical protein JCM11641_000944 [Rhodosporidiobolus odoratus]
MTIFESLFLVHGVNPLFFREFLDNLTRDSPKPLPVPLRQQYLREIRTKEWQRLFRHPDFANTLLNHIPVLPQIELNLFHVVSGWSSRILSGSEELEKKKWWNPLLHRYFSRVALDFIRREQSGDELVKLIELETAAHGALLEFVRSEVAKADSAAAEKILADLTAECVCENPNI